MYQAEKQPPIQPLMVQSQVPDLNDFFDFFLAPGANDDQFFQLYQISGPVTRLN